MTDAIVRETFAYSSSVDDTGPLYADVAYNRDGRPKPILAVMHGYSGTRDAVQADLEQLAARGVFAVAPDMRGAGDSAGEFDSGAVEIHDIVDALLHVARAYAGEVDARSVNVVGYSGGGGNALSLATKFPDLLHVAVSFFGVSDYALWYEMEGRPDCNEICARTLGGTPEEVPARYEARSALLAAGNNGHTHIHLFWDEDETACPPILNTEYIAASQAAGHGNVTAHVSKAGDAVRWRHNYRQYEPDLARGDDLFLPDVFDEPKRPPLPKRGMLMVAGYVVTRHFQVWIADGREGLAAVRYDISGAQPEVVVVSNPTQLPVRIETTSPTAALP